MTNQSEIAGGFKTVFQIAERTSWTDHSLVVPNPLKISGLRSRTRTFPNWVKYTRDGRSKAPF